MDGKCDKSCDGIIGLVRDWFGVDLRSISDPSRIDLGVWGGVVEVIGIWNIFFGLSKLCVLHLRDCGILISGSGRSGLL